MNELRARDLRFTRDEVETFLATPWALAYPPQIALLEAHRGLDRWTY
jgi:hypothetical protein